MQTQTRNYEFYSLSPISRMKWFRRNRNAVYPPTNFYDSIFPSYRRQSDKDVDSTYKNYLNSFNDYVSRFAKGDNITKEKAQFRIIFDPLRGSLVRDPNLSEEEKERRIGILRTLLASWSGISTEDAQDPLFTPGVDTRDVVQKARDKRVEAEAEERRRLKEKRRRREEEEERRRREEEEERMRRKRRREEEENTQKRRKLDTDDSYPSVIPNAPPIQYETLDLESEPEPEPEPEPNQNQNQNQNQNEAEADVPQILEEDNREPEEDSSEPEEPFQDASYQRLKKLVEKGFLIHKEIIPTPPYAPDYKGDEKLIYTVMYNWDSDDPRINQIYDEAIHGEETKIFMISDLILTWNRPIDGL